MTERSTVAYRVGAAVAGHLAGHVEPGQTAIWEHRADGFPVEEVLARVEERAARAQATLVGMAVAPDSLLVVELWRDPDDGGVTMEFIEAQHRAPFQVLGPITHILTGVRADAP